MIAVRRLLILVSAIIFVDVMLFTALTPLIPGYVDEFDLSKIGAGVLVGAFGAGAIVGGVLGGLAAARLGPKRAVVAGLVLLGLASLAFAAADSATTLVAARLIQGFSSTITWAGALAWLAVTAPKERRGEIIGTAFGAAVVGAVLGPMFGGVAHAVGTGPAFAAVAVVAFASAAVAAIPRGAPAESVSSAGISRALRDPRFLGGLWLNTLPAFLFGVLVVLGPLALDAGGWSTVEIAAVFFAAGLVEAVANPVLGRVSDRYGRRLPIRGALAVSIVVGAALAAATEPLAVAFFVVAGFLGFGGMYTPGMALTSHRAEAAGLAQGLAFGIMNSAWALGELVGPTLGGVLAEAFGDAAPYLVGRRALRGDPDRDAGRGREEVATECSVRTGIGATRSRGSSGAPSRIASWSPRSRTSSRVAHSTWRAARAGTRSGSRSSAGASPASTTHGLRSRKRSSVRPTPASAWNSSAPTSSSTSRSPTHSTSSSSSISSFRPSSGAQCSRRRAAALAPDGTLLVVGHDLLNLSEGVGGPSDPGVLYTPDDIVADLGGLEVQKAERVLRDVADADRPAIDVLVRAVRPPERR